MDVGWLWLLGFRVSGNPAEIDATLRSEGLSLVRSLPGIADSFAGRRGVDADWEHVLAATATDELSASDMDERAYRWLCGRWPGEVTGVESRVRRLAAVLRFPRGAMPTILRVYYGEVRSGELDRYVDGVRSGAAEDAAHGYAPVALFVATDPPSRFTTVSAWTSWEEIEQATGGNVAHPIASRRHESLVGGSALHYELIADPVLDHGETAA